MKWFLILLALYIPHSAFAQGETNVWTFSTNAGLDFNTTPPTPITTAINTGEACASVCTPDGKLLFYTDGSNLYNRNHLLMPNGLLLSNYCGPASGNSYDFPTWSTTQGAVIVPMPGSCNLFYVFSLEQLECYDGHFYYSVVDMNLDGGFGDVVPGQKLIPVDSFMAEKMAAVKGNNNDVWLVLHPRNFNKYYSYHITSSGFNPVPVVSYAGSNFIGGFISNYSWGCIKFTADRQHLLAAIAGSPGFVERYQFNPATGIISNPEILIPGSTYTFALSADNTKLYRLKGATGIEQYDLTQPTALAVQSSLIVMSPPSSIGVGEQTGIALGPDGKIYYSNGFSPDIYVINKPNLPGPQCDVSNTPIVLNDTVGYLLEFPAAIVPSPPSVVDSIYAVFNVNSCFGEDQLILVPSDTTHAYGFRWDNQEANISRIVDTPGVYWLKYMTWNPCAYHVDSFKVNFTRVPASGDSIYVCPGTAAGVLKIGNAPGDTSTYTYTWKDPANTTLQVHQTNNGDSLSGISPGLYSVRISYGSCDTVLQLAALPYPVPEAGFTNDSLVCVGEMVQFISSGPVSDTWWNFGDSRYDSLTLAPVHVYDRPGLYIPELIVMNAEGCRDTSAGFIRVNDFELQLSADKNYIEQNATVTLSTHGSSSYSMIAWLPQDLFADQSLLSQTVLADTSRIFVAVGISAEGCVDTAEASLIVVPKVMIPSAFSPNGDGLNDYFRPFSDGIFFVREFRVFDRWGNCVWNAYGNIGKGWDGTYHGVPADLGVYFYMSEVSLEGGKVIVQKGDVTLVR